MSRKNSRKTFQSAAIVALMLVDRMVNWKVEECEAVRRLTGLLIGPERDPGDASSSVVSIVLTLSDRGIDDPATAVAEIEAAAAASGVAMDELHIDGASITSLAIDREVKASTWNLVDPWQRPPVFAISAFFGILLAFFTLRSVRLGIMGTASAWFTALVTTSLIPAMGHTMNMVTIVMPTLLVVLTVSAAIHVANYWKHASAKGAEHPVQEAIRMGWPPCLMATVTTCVGLASLTTSRLGPIRDFGAFSTVGVVLSFAVVIVAFPAMLRLSKMRIKGRRAESRIWQKIARSVCRVRNPVIIGSVLLFLTTAFGLQWLKTEVKVGRYFPEHSQLIQDSRFFENNVGGTSSIDVLLHFGDDYSDKKLFLERMELVRAVEEAIRQHTNITGAISLADFQPATVRPGSQEGQGARTKYVLRSRRTEQKIKRDELAASSEYLAISTDPEFAWSLGTDLDETWRITAQTLLSKDLDSGTITRELSEIVEETLGVRTAHGSTSQVACRFSIKLKRHCWTV